MPVPAPLHGVRVVDFGQYVPGPLAAVLLADHGADVVHVDPPGGPRWDSPADAFLNRGKRRITLDLKAAADLETARRLVDHADVLIENHRPGVMDRLGLGWEETRAHNSRLVYCSLPGFAAEDPRRDLPGWEGVIAAATGNCRPRSGEAPTGWDDTRPTYTAVPIASNFAAFLGAVGVVAALTARHRTGRGQRVEVPLFHAMFEAIGAAGAFLTPQGVRREAPLTANGSGTYRCADGRYVQFNPIGSSGRFLRWFLDAAGATAWTAEGLTDARRLQAEPALAARLRERLGDLFLTRPASDWEELATNAGVPLARIRTTAEWLTCEHAQASGQVVCAEDPMLGPVWLPGRSVGTAGEAAAPPPPRHLPDQDRREILADLERPVPPPSEEVSGAPEPVYGGLRVLDLTQILAGPTSGRILGELGAEVVKINAPQRRVAAHGFVNRGKQTVLLDIETESGQDVFWRLVEQADVVVQNFPQGTAERYGVGYEQVRARRPDVVYVSVSCYGYGGPWMSRRGYETQGQAATGIMARAGGGAHRPAVLGPYNLLDFGTGVMAAFAAALGIHHHLTTGEGLHLTTSLTQTGTWHQGRYALDFESRRWDEPSGPEALGEHALQRFYRARDGWFFLGAGQEQREAVRVASGVRQLTEEELEAAFRSRSVVECVGALRAAGAGAHAVVSLPDLMADPSVRAQGLAVQQLSEEVGEVTMPGVAIRLSDTPLQVGAAVRQPGADGRLVLDALGWGDAAERLEREWALQLSGLPAGWDRS